MRIDRPRERAASGSFFDPNSTISTAATISTFHGLSNSGREASRRGQSGPYGGHLRLHEPVGEFLFHAGRSEGPAIRRRTAGRPRLVLAGPSPPRAMTPVGLAAEHGCCTPRAKPLGDREQVVVQVPAAHSQRHLIEEADSGWLSCSSMPWPGRRRVDCGRRSGETDGRRVGQGNGMAEPLPGKRRPARDGSFPAAIRRGAETLARVGQ
jgi:hypothetical protein